MAIKMQTCYTDQTATVNKLLNDDWEPFTIVPVKAKKNDVLVTRLKVYFRKHELEYRELIAPSQESTVDQSTEKFEELITELVSSLASFAKQTQLENQRFSADILDTMTRAVKSFEDILNKFTVEKAGQVTIGSLLNREYKVGDPYPKPIEPNDSELPDEIGMEPDSHENDSPEESRLDSDSGISGGGDVPGGDGFRVVENIPSEIITSSSRTQAQEEQIKYLKDRYGNISVFSAPNGQVKVLGGTYIYYIKPSGETIEEKTNANTNSLVV